MGPIPKYILVHRDCGSSGWAVEEVRQIPIGLVVGTQDTSLPADSRTTTAPAPSPNSTQVARSSQSTMELNFSVATTRAISPPTGRDITFRYRERIDETRAGTNHVEGNGFRSSDEGLNIAGGGGKQAVGRRRRNDQDVHILGCHTGSLHGDSSGSRTHICGGHLWERDTALANSGSLEDPRIGGLDDRFHISIRHDAVG